MITPQQILFEDNYLLALNKPHGLVTERDERIPETLESLALDYVKSKTNYPQKCYMGLPHRLDRPVSGVVLLAKKKSVLKLLGELFANRAIEKTYLAITENRPPQAEGELTNWMVKDLKQRKAIITAKEGKGAVKAALTYSVISQNEDATLFRIRLLTGKFHQIRAQLAHIGCRIIGDTLYSSSKPYKENSIALHASQLELTHPITHAQLKIIAPVPQDELWQRFNL